MTQKLLAAALACAALVRPVWAQCPDGTPPPCRGAGRTNAPPGNSIAVLTFDNLSRDTGQTYLAEGLANDISTQLGQIERLTVTSRTMVRRLPNITALTPQAMGRALAAAYLVSGGVQGGPNRVHVSVELLRAATGQAVWASQFDRTTADLLAIQQEIAASVAASVAGRLLPQERAALGQRSASNGEAYDHLLRGDFLLRQRTKEGAERALTEYEAAVRLDPGSARARASVGEVLGLCADWYWRCRGLGNDSLVALARAAVDSALARDSLSAEAYAARAGIEYDLDHARGLVDVERAIALQPRNARFHHQRGWILAEDLRFDEAIREYRRALTLDPALAATYEHLARIATIQRRFDDALADLDSAIRLEPEMTVVYARRAMLRAWLGDKAGMRADVAALRGRGAGPDLDRYLAGLEALAAAATGDTAAAGARLDSLRAAGGAAEIASATEGTVATAIRIGRGNGFLASLPPNFTIEPFWAAYPWYDPVRADPRFQAGLERWRQGVR
ncbi:MAG TPA: tetratricopeptide repeat protein [Gemmatimonadales bacterium]|nr:tetratricopeptide repeat protein [Gemmatimonadales bacterium]